MGEYEVVNIEGHNITQARSVMSLLDSADRILTKID